MPLIEELANPTAHAAAPGWAYVPDTGYDPSKAAIVPSGTRNRQARAGQGGATSAVTTAAASARQQNRVTKRLATLEKENHRDVVITVPGRTKDVGSRGLHGKMTTGVRRILTSEKNVAHHLADEEAAIANNQFHPIEQFPRPKPRSPAKSKSRLQHELKKSQPKKSFNTASTQSDAHVDASTGNESHLTQMEIDEEDDIDDSPLLKVSVPPLPSAEEIEALLAAPPLSYADAQAAPSTTTAPPRQFCEMCGYWGRVRCMKCGVRLCGLDCKIQHDETNCLKFYA